MIDKAFLALISAWGRMEAEETPPTASSIHWTAGRKAALVTAVNGGKISLEQAKRQFRLSDEEFNSWIAALEKNGAPGLRATRFQLYRDNPRRRTPDPSESNPQMHRAWFGNRVREERPAGRCSQQSSPSILLSVANGRVGGGALTASTSSRVPGGPWSNPHRIATRREI